MALSFMTFWLYFCYVLSNCFEMDQVTAYAYVMAIISYVTSNYRHPDDVDNFYVWYTYCNLQKNYLNL